MTKRTTTEQSFPTAGRRFVRRLVPILVSLLLPAPLGAPRVAQWRPVAQADDGASDTASSQANSGSVEARLKDLVEIRGVRSNPLVGFGLVVGLPGTGDSRQSLATNEAAARMLTRLGERVKPSEVTTKNLAAVIVTADLPPFARIGDKLDVRISSVGDAASLEGGSLVLTPLSGADGIVYAVAQGAVSMGTSMVGYQGGSGSSSAQGGAPKTVGLSRGATVEREFESRFVTAGALELSLRNPDFTTANRITKAINDEFHEFLAEPKNAGLIKVRLPSGAMPGNPSFTPVAFVSHIEQLRIEADSKAVVVINERTGTIISGMQVMIAPVAISHGNLEVLVKRRPVHVAELPRSTTVGELVSALNALGAGPKDLVAILQALEAAHALKAEIRLM